MPNRKLIPIGTRFGTFTVIEERVPVKGSTEYRVVCDCGDTQWIKNTLLTRSYRMKCKDCTFVDRGIPITHIKIGMQFGCWAVIDDAAVIVNIINYEYLCRCLCGYEKLKKMSHLKRARIRNGRCRTCYLELIRRR